MKNTLKNFLLQKNKKFIYVLKFPFLKLIMLIIALISCSDYPKNEAELGSMLTDQCWKNESFTIDQIYVNDSLIPKPGDSDVRKTLMAVFDDNSQLYDTFKTTLDTTKSDDSFFFCHYNDTKNKYFWLELSFNETNSRYEFTTEDVVFTNSDDKYSCEKTNYNPTIYDVEYNIPMPSESGTTISKYIRKVEKVTKNELVMVNDITFVTEDSQKIRCVFTTTSKPLVPQKKYLDIVDEEKKRWLTQ
jgi:hypothetical protein